MENFLTFLEEHFNGILILILLLVVVVLCLRWIAQIFGWGRFSRIRTSKERSESMTYVITKIFVKIIDDFKHFLALVIVILFVVLIIFSMAATNVFAEKMEALQLVIASLGGLLGSIIGYYYGESAARVNLPNVITNDTGENVQATPDADGETNEGSNQHEEKTPKKDDVVAADVEIPTDDDPNETE